MKKFIIVLAAVCVVLAVVLGLGTVGKQRPAVPAASEETTDVAVTAAPAAAEPAQSAQPAETAAEPSAEPAPETSPSTVPDEPSTASGRLNYAALYALHEPDEKVLKVGDREERWGDYFYVLFTQSGQIEDYFNSMSAYYGMQYGWGDPIEEGGEETFADTALDSAERLTVQLAALEKFAEENGVEFDDEILAAIEEQKQQDILAALGEEGTEEDFITYLEKIYLTPDMYNRIVTQNFLYQESFNRIYGENAANLSDDEALTWLTDNGYVSANHILFLFSNRETGETLTDEQKAEKKAELEAILEELRAIEDPEERAAAFGEKVKEISEDTGKDYYPEGYTYTAGTMVPEFESAAEALGEYEISDVVETSYGYHIIMRMPLKADGIVEFNSSTGEPRTARMLAANQDYSKRLQAVADELSVEWLEGCERPDLLSFVAE